MVAAPEGPELLAGLAVVQRLLQIRRRCDIIANALQRLLRALQRLLVLVPAGGDVVLDQVLDLYQAPAVQLVLVQPVHRHRTHAAACMQISGRMRRAVSCIVPG